MEKEDRWDGIFNALRSIDTYLYLKGKGFVDENGLNARGKELLDKMEKVYSMC